MILWGGGGEKTGGGGRKMFSIPLIRPLSTAHVDGVQMDKPGCCSIEHGQFHAHKHSQGSVRAQSCSTPNRFMLLYQKSLLLSLSLSLSLCASLSLPCTYKHTPTHTHTQQFRRGHARCQRSVLEQLNLVVMMKEFICHLFLQLKTN